MPLAQGLVQLRHGVAKVADALKLYFTFALVLHTTESVTPRSGKGGRHVESVLAHALAQTQTSIDFGLHKC